MPTESVTLAERLAEQIASATSRLGRAYLGNLRVLALSVVLPGQPRIVGDLFGLAQCVACVFVTVREGLLASAGRRQLRGHRARVTRLRGDRVRM
jgi:hypothetical protein